MQTTTLDLSADMIDVRDIIARFEELDPEYSTIQLTSEEREELETLTAILEDLKGNGGDEQFRGDWYPRHLVRDCYFTTYAREMLENCGIVPADLPSWVEIDWDATAHNVRMDYSRVTIDGATYWYR
jgi:hypothetical protein